MKVKCKFYAWNVKGLGLYHISKVLIKGLPFTQLHDDYRTKIISFDHFPFARAISHRRENGFKLSEKFKINQQFSAP